MAAILFFVYFDHTAEQSMQLNSVLLLVLMRIRIVALTHSFQNKKDAEKKMPIDLNSIHKTPELLYFHFFYDIHTMVR